MLRRVCRLPSRFPRAVRLYSEVRIPSLLICDNAIAIKTLTNRVQNLEKWNMNLHDTIHLVRTNQVRLLIQQSELARQNLIAMEKTCRLLDTYIAHLAKHSTLE